MIIKKLSDHDAGLIQAVENSHRKGLSDYAKGMSYARMIDRDILKQKDLIKTLQISHQQVSRLLSFRNIPDELTATLGNLTKISSRTSEEIVRLAKKGEKYISALKMLAEPISTGKVASKSLVTRVVCYSSLLA